MKAKKNGVATAQKSRPVTFKTTIFDLFTQLIDGEMSDALAIASIRRIFSRYNARLARTSTPLRLAASIDSSRIQSSRAALKIRANWA